MIRKVYLDFIRDKLSQRDFRWLAARGMQYLLAYASSLVRRPLCGPILGTLVTNYRCNYRCQMCDLRLRDQELQGRGLREFDTDGMKRVLRDFAALGTSGIGFTGGEPLLRKDVFELLAYTKALGMFSHLNTNGYFLDDGAARKIIEAKVDSINISLDGARPETHNRIRGFSGAFDRALDAIGRIGALRKKTAAQLRIKTVAVINEDNIDEVGPMIDLSRDLMVDCVEFIPRQDFVSAGGSCAVRDPGFLAKVDRLTEFLLGYDAKGVRIENSRTHLKLFPASFRNAESKLRCFAGYTSLAVDCYGEIYPCVPWYNWRQAVGNMQGTDLTTFWNSTEYNAVRTEIARCKRCYLNCQAELNILFNPLVKV